MPSWILVFYSSTSPFRTAVSLTIFQTQIGRKIKILQPRSEKKKSVIVLSVTYCLPIQSSRLHKQANSLLINFVRV